MLTFGIDFDDVIAPFNERAVELANEKYLLSPPLSIQDLTTWENNSGRASCVKEFYSRPDIYNRQYVPDESKKFIRELMKKGEVFIVTSVYPQFMGTRVEQIKAAFPEFPDENIIMGSRKSLMSFDITLDDCPENILKSTSRYPVLMRKPWNKDMTGVLAVHNFEEFSQLLEQIKESMVEDKVIPETPAVIALVGPSGSNKQAVANALVENYPHNTFAESYTTNPAAGKPYRATRFRHVVTQETFDSMLPEFQETTMYAGFAYGTTYGDIKGVLSEGYNVVMPLDLSGAISMKRNFPTVIIFCKRSREAMIMDILKTHRDDTLREQMLRLLSIENELKNAHLCDYTIKTENPEDAARQIMELFGDRV